jgi:hypothetical protein
MEAVGTAPERELALHGRVQRGQPLRRLRLEADVVASDLFRYQSSTMTTSIQPRGSTLTVVMAMPHH